MPNKSRRRGVLTAATAVLAGAIALVPAAGDATATNTQPYIVGGTEASIADHPYAVYLTDRDGNQFCGGVLISGRGVLTAAHCAQAMKRTELRVVAGRQDQRTSAGVVSEVDKVWINPQFRDPTTGNDVAVLTLDEEMPYRAAKLPDTGDADLYREGTKAKVLGWGRTADGGPRSDYLRGALVPVVSDESCKNSFSSYDKSTMLCAGYPDGGVDACQGDSGGPLLVGDTVIGIVSWGEGCARPDRPGVYARVAAFTTEVRSQD
ncbi:trypsin-like serine protease [Amycolatopsis sp. YIM 10]|uniref:S1 family peptidase n=1 Tax=Amycolatopsis sp. YIM 10 TaxID=2653857 RepID=UPI00128FEC84|nr:serine protease [Amycolatopsis sp. YIM 10]QFU87556.1 Trypsin [Amycolatopsis sp. YIM 10]